MASWSPEQVFDPWFGATKEQLATTSRPTFKIHYALLFYQKEKAFMVESILYKIGRAHV